MGYFIYIGVMIVAYLVFGTLRDHKIKGGYVEPQYWLSMVTLFIATVYCFTDNQAENFSGALFLAIIISAFLALWWHYQKPPVKASPAEPDPMWKVYQDLVSNPPKLDYKPALERASATIDTIGHPTGPAMKKLLAMALRYEKPEDWEHPSNSTPHESIAKLQKFYSFRAEIYDRKVDQCIPLYRQYVKDIPVTEGEFASPPGYASPASRQITQAFVYSLPLEYINDAVFFDEPKNLPLHKIYERLEGITETFFTPYRQSIPEQSRFEHTWLLGPPGSGKTQTIQHLITRDLDKRASIFVMDSQGDLVRNVSTIASIQDRLLLVEPETVSVNPFDLRGDASIDLLTYVFGALGEGAEFTPRQKMLYHFGIRLMQEVPNATLLTFVDLLTNGLDPYERYVDRLGSSAQMFFRDDFRAKGLQETKDGVGWRLKLLLSDPTFERMFTEPTNVDLKRALDQGQVVVVDTSKEKLGGERSALFGRFMLAYLLYASQQRASQAQGDRLPVYAYIDEAHEYLADDSVATILDQARKMRVAMLLANQRSAQVKNSNMLDALMATSIKLIRTDTDASLSRLAKVMHCDPDELSGLSKTPQVFGLYVRGWESMFPAVIPFGSMEQLDHVATPRRVLKAHPPKVATRRVEPEPSPIVDPTASSPEL